MLLRVICQSTLRLSCRFSTPKTFANIKQLLKVYGQQLEQSKAMQKMIPRNFDQVKLQKMSHNQRFSQGKNHTQSLTLTFSQPIWDLLDRGGKRWRPALAMLVAQLYGHPRASVMEIAAACQIIHNGTLLIDDIQDSSTVRRNKPCVHLIYGTDIAINSGNMMYFVPMLALTKKYQGIARQRMTQIYLQEMTQLHIGQGWDILWHNIDPLHGNYPTQEQYLQMTAHKTGVLARMAARLACAAVNAPPVQEDILSRFVQSMGVAFQIQDDLLNLQGQQFKATKGYFGQDIHQGKITLMVIHYLRNSKKQDQNRLLDILRKHTEDQKEIEEAINLMRSSGSLQYARCRMEKLIQQAVAQLDQHFTDSQPLRMLKQLAQFGISRTT